MEASAQDAGPGGDAPASTTEREGADPSDEDALTHAEPTRPTAADGIEDDLPGMKERLLLKAESAAWAASRWRRLDEHADYRLEIVPQDQEFFQKGKAVGCYLWMLTTRVPRPSSPDDYELIAACFENLAEAVALVQHVGIQAGWNPEPLKPCLTLLAKAQSALRGAVAACGGYADADQAEVFTWLRAFTQEKEVFIEQGMRSDNLADPTEWASLAGELHALQVEFDAQLRGRRRKKKLLAKLKHKASVVSSSPPDRKREAWQDVMTVVDNLVEAGVQPSRAEIREVLLPIIDSLPELLEMPTGFSLVVREMERYRTSGGRQEAPQGGAGGSSDVQAVARRLAGRSVVLIGAEERREAKAALEEAFGLGELVWIATKEHESFRNFEPHVARPDVAVVLLAIRWSSHSFAEVADLCRRHGKPLVRLPGGYNPNQVAAQIMAQASRRLGEG